jgi:lysophospholipase L1-like esterase
VRALGTVLLYGMVLERPGPGIVYDSLGLVGARAQRLVNFDPAHIEAQIRARDVDLLVLGFGGNEASDSIDPEVYARDFEEVIRRMRSGREDLGCLVVAPLDQADGNGRTFRGVPTIVATQREVAHRMGCAFFDTWNAMGGSGAMTRWRRTTPRLAMGDGRHAAPEGYEVISNMMYKALLEGFASYLRLHGGR